MKRRGILLLFAGALAIALAILLSIKPVNKVQHHPASIAVPSTDIHSIEVHLDGKSHWRLHKQNDQWSMNTDTRMAIDQDKVQALLVSLTQPLPRCYAKEEFHAEKFRDRETAFDISIEVFVNDKPGFAIAGYAALDHQRYLLTGTDVCLVSELFAWQFMRPVGDYLQVEAR